MVCLYYLVSEWLVVSGEFALTTHCSQLTSLLLSSRFSIYFFQYVKERFGRRSFSEGGLLLYLNALANLPLLRFSRSFGGRWWRITDSNR